MSSCRSTHTQAGWRVGSVPQLKESIYVRQRLVATLTGLAMAGGLTACATNAPTTPPSFISVYGSEPQNPLLPTNTTETGGGSILENLFVGLVEYETDGTPYNEVAKSITPNKDSTEFRVKLKDG